MHRYTFYAILSIIVILILSTFIPYFSILLIAIVFILSLSSDRKPHKKTDHHVHIHLDTVPYEYYTAYRKYLVSDKWKQLRSLILLRDSHTCIDCGSTTDLQVHHLHYDGIETMTFTTEQLVTVCETCHAHRHS